MPCITEFKQPRQQEHHKSAFLTVKKSSSTRFARAVFIFGRSRFFHAGKFCDWCSVGNDPSQLALLMLFNTVVHFLFVSHQTHLPGSNPITFAEFVVSFLGNPGRCVIR